MPSSDARTPDAASEQECPACRPVDDHPQAAMQCTRDEGCILKEALAAAPVAALARELPRVSLSDIRNYRRVISEVPIPHQRPREVTEVWVALVEAVEAMRDFWQSGDDEASDRVAAALDVFDV